MDQTARLEWLERMHEQAQGRWLVTGDARQRRLRDMIGHAYEHAIDEPCAAYGTRPSDGVCYEPKAADQPTARRGNPYRNREEN